MVEVVRWLHNTKYKHIEHAIIEATGTGTGTILTMFDINKSISVVAIGSMWLKETRASWICFGGVFFLILPGSDKKDAPDGSVRDREWLVNWKCNFPSSAQKHWTQPLLLEIL